MTQNFITYLEALQTDDMDKRRELAKKVAPNLVYNYDGKDTPVRELLLSNSVEGSTLIQSEIYATVIEGSEPAISMREAMMVIPTQTDDFSIPYGETGTYADVVNEGAEIPVDTQNYTKATPTIRKYGARPLITREMVEDCKFGIVNLEVMKAGRRLENALNRHALSTLLEGSGAETDRSGTNLGIKAVAAAISVTKGNGFIPDTLIMHPEAEGLILSDLASVSSYFPVGTAATNGQFPQVLGLSAHSCGIADNSATYVWDYDSDGDMGMLIIDKMSAAAIAMRQDIRVEQYNDPVKDLVGASCTMRFGATTLVANAATRVRY